MINSINEMTINGAYYVEDYAADGHGSGPAGGSGQWFPSLAEARADVRSRLGVSRLSAARRWRPGYDEADEDRGLHCVAAYHDYPPSHRSAAGCGGSAIYERAAV